MAAAYGRTANFCGAAGLDLMEPLTFKGREGSGQPGGRCAYADSSLNPEQDWQKHDLYYRVWGRKLYNPNADPETWRRAIRAEFDAGTEATENSLAHASRILPLLTSAHLASASNHDLWYELPTNMPIVDGSEPSPYSDTPAPKVFGTVSPLDPQMFSSVVEYAQELITHKPGAKYSPIEVAQWLEDCIAASREALDEARRTVKTRSGSAFRRMEEDVLIQIGLGAFFAHKLRSSVLYEIFKATTNPQAGKLAIEHYQNARDTWATMATRAKSVYRANVSYGSIPKRSGHWLDRLPAVDVDLAAMKAKVAAAAPSELQPILGDQGVQAATARPQRPEARCAHTPPERFTPGQALQLRLTTASGEGVHDVHSVRLLYRHVDQAERWNAMDASAANGAYTAAIPAEYTQSEFALEYYFELEDGRGLAWMYPGLDKTLSNQPYFAISTRNA
jgi:hypothetical protein